VNDRNRDRNRDRRGTMLAQMVIVMSCMSILITLSGTLLFRLLHQQVEMTKSVVQTGTWARLARDFRTDVHGAKSAKQAGENGNALTLTVDDGTVTWRSDGEFTPGQILIRPPMQHRASDTSARTRPQRFLSARRKGQQHLPFCRSPLWKLPKAAPRQHRFESRLPSA
jgi:hypothetical protein